MFRGCGSIDIPAGVFVVRMMNLTLQRGKDVDADRQPTSSAPTASVTRPMFFPDPADRAETAVGLDAGPTVPTASWSHRGGLSSVRAKSFALCVPSRGAPLFWQVSA